MEQARLLAAAVGYISDPLLWASRDGREGHYIVSHSQAGRHHKTLYKFGFVGFRFVRFSTGLTLVSWCHHCPCGGDAAAGGLLEGDVVVAGRDYPTSTQQQVFEDQLPPQCAAAAALLARIGGQGPLQQVLAAGRHHRHRPLGTAFAIPVRVSNSTAYTAVSTGAGTVGSWGVIRELPSGHTCNTCGRRHCRHTSSFQGLPGQQQQQLPGAPEQQQQQQQQRADAYMSPQQYEQVLKKFMDPEMRSRRLTSITSGVLAATDRTIPRTRQQQPHVADVIRQRTSGHTALPEQIGPSQWQLQQACLGCGQVHWGTLPYLHHSPLPWRTHQPQVLHGLTMRRSIISQAFSLSSSFGL
jgi:hypothetical protein